MAVQHQVSRTVAVPQVQFHTENSTVQIIDTAVQSAISKELSADQPRILYQCGDCDEVFKSLELWQHHRKEGTCQQGASDNKSASESQPEPETVASPSPAPELNPQDGDLTEGDTSKSDHVEAVAQHTTEEVWQEVDQASEAQNAETPLLEAAASTSNAEELSPKKRGTIKRAKPEPVLLCVDCGSCFGLVSELVAHRKIHGFEDALHHCSVCGESFLNTTLFLYHRKQHRQKGEEKAAAVAAGTTQEGCAQSDRSGEQDAVPSATSVVSTFTLPELFMCIQCGDSFSDDAGLIAHRKEKHDLREPLHTCAHCGESFMNTTQYLYHRQQHRLTLDSAVVDGDQTGDEVVITSTQDTTQSSKRLLSSPSAATESGSPLSKRSRPTIRIQSGAGEWNC